MVSSWGFFVTLFIFNTASDGEALTRDSNQVSEREEKIPRLVGAPIINITFNTSKSQAKNYSRSNSSELNREDVFSVKEYNDMRAEYKEINIIPETSHKIILSSLAGNSIIYTANNSNVYKEKWSKEDESLEQVIVPNESLDNDDINNHSEKNTMPAKIADFLSKLAISDTSSIKLQKRKEDTDKNITNNLLLVFPSISNNRTNNYTKPKIDKENNNYRNLENRHIKDDVENEIEKLKTQTINTMDIKVTPGLPIDKNTVPINFNRKLGNNSGSNENSNKNLYDNLIYISSKDYLTDKQSKPSNVEQKEKHTKGESSLLRIVNKTLRLGPKVADFEPVKSDGENNIPYKKLPRDILSLINKENIHNITSVPFAGQNVIVNNETTEPGGNFVYTNMSNEEYAELLTDTITTDSLVNKIDLRSFGKKAKKKFVKAINNKKSQPLVLILIINQ